MKMTILSPVYRLSIIAAAIFLLATTLCAQSSSSVQGPVPADVVNDLWMNATAGELLSPETWNRETRFYVHSNPLPKKFSFDVVSNSWAVGPVIIRGDKAEVDVNYVAAGKIDSLLHYTPPPKIPFMKTAIPYHLTIVEGYNVMHGSDGKTVVSKSPSGTRGWQISDPRAMPWTTVNTAVRYVLEMRAKTDDPVIKRNADEALLQLLKLH
jgi:hypothetical protein